jgi:hypothetical protein
MQFVNCGWSYEGGLLIRMSGLSHLIFLKSIDRFVSWSLSLLNKNLIVKIK